MSDRTDDVGTADEAERAARELHELAEAWEAANAALRRDDAGWVAGEELSFARAATRQYRANRLALVGLVVLGVMLVLAAFVPVVDSSDIIHHNYPDATQGPSLEYPFGTDSVGRDLWKRAWVGARVSLAIGFATALVILVVGVVYGSISGYVGGRTDNTMMRLLDALYGLPYLPFAIIFVTTIRDRHPDATPIAYMVPALALTTWFTAARIMRGQVLSVKENEFVHAARSLGARSYRLLAKHLVPNTLGILVVAIFLEVPGAILGEATLSWLGLGVQPPNASLGSLAHEGSQWFGVAPHMVWVPSLMIAAIVLSAMAVADGLRDALDPRGKRL